MIGWLLSIYYCLPASLWDHPVLQIFFWIDGFVVGLIPPSPLLWVKKAVGGTPLLEAYCQVR